jgi:hypothetical protein
MHPTARTQIAQLLAQSVRAHVPPHPPAGAMGLYRAMADLAANGMVQLGELLTAEQVADIRRHLAPHPVYDRWIAYLSDGPARPLDQAATHAPFGAYASAVIQTAPHLLELAVHPWVQSVAEQYLGCPPTLTSLNIWWSFPGHTVSQVGNSQDFHRDVDTYRSCVLFVYLTDVTTQSGPHCYITRSHSLESVSAVFAERDIRVRRSDVAGKSV